jgi:signal transduction histidine kinase
VLVSLRAEDNQIVVVIQDDGVGFEPSARSRGGLGLLGIQERVQELDGSLKIVSGRQQGTTLRAEIPIGVVA